MNKELIAIIKPDGAFEMDWQENSGLKEESAQSCEIIYQNYLRNPDEALFLLGFQERSIPFSPSIHFLKNVADLYIKTIAGNPDTKGLWEKSKPEPDEEKKKYLLENAPFMLGFGNLGAAWFRAAWGKLHAVFKEKLPAYGGSAAALLSALNPAIRQAGRIFFHLVENKQEDQPFAFLATYSSHITNDGQLKHVPLKHALVEYGENSKKLLDLLITVQKTAEKSQFVADILASGEIFHPLALSAAEAYTFLKEIPLYEESGIVCRIPDWWKQRKNSVNVTLRIGNKQPSFVGKDALLDFNVDMMINGAAISNDEIRQLLSEAEGLALIKGRWIEIDHKKLHEALGVYEKAHKLAARNELSFFDAIRLQLNPEKALGMDALSEEVDVNNGEWLSHTLAKLVNPQFTGSETVNCGPDFKAALRSYQHQGFNWLFIMHSLQFGACLADDMGLGKTVQIIALLDKLRADKDMHSLLVIPASLIANWTAEIKRFAPALKFYIAHPSENKKEPGAEDILACDLVITTYSLLTRYTLLSDWSWSCLIIDEAQAIKNPGTKQTKAVKRVKAGYKVALTGTPIENRLTDLWCLFDFLNPGLLGNIREFGNFIKQLEKSDTGYSRLKKVVGPFLLRRIKTDKAVIADLPEKIEMKTYAHLTKKQVVLYKELLSETADALSGTRSGISRKGVILSSLLKFKQLCNHPDHYLGGKAFPEEESGKFERLREICETIYEKRERVLVFTQFKEIIPPMVRYLESIFGHQGLMLHGEIPVAKRKQIVERFQQEGEYVPFLVLSLKAGGVGLNLTQANHVIHFDRWWNPAVENQATDRAFRIGQQRNVVVHKFITRGTVEEKIDQMIESKTGLADAIITDKQETPWLTEMTDKELLDIFRLTVQ